RDARVLERILHQMRIDDAFGVIDGSHEWEANPSQRRTQAQGRKPQRVKSAAARPAKGKRSRALPAPNDVTLAGRPAPEPDMADEKAPVVTHFIRQIVLADREAGRLAGGPTTRFPPEPNGHLHIGHAKAICLNFGIAREFGGRCNLRLDDTNPGKEDPAFVEGIKDSVHWLGFEWSELRHASDYFEVLYRAALKLIEDGKAYVDDLSADEVRAYRGTLTEPGRDSPYRNRPVEENLDLFRRMRAGEFADGSRTLRAKIDMASGNINLRDP